MADNPIINYLSTDHHSSVQSLITQLKQITNYLSANDLNNDVLIDRLNLQLDADNINADLFYSQDLAPTIHQLISTIRRQVNPYNEV